MFLKSCISSIKNNFYKIRINSAKKISAKKISKNNFLEIGNHNTVQFFKLCKRPFRSLLSLIVTLYTIEQLV
jgi:hypothetical protein